uniref:RNA-directed RNA polymerase n=1 Tax=Rice virus X TaxID=106518 RepID=Q9IR21_9TOMB|nr:54 kDa protein [Rice virus X]
MIVSLEQRVFRVKKDGAFVRPPLPVPGAFNSCIAFRILWLAKLHSEGPVLKSTVAEVVQCYTAEKRKLYEAAAQTLAWKPICRRDSHIRAFIKVEKLESDVKDPVPRTIQPRSRRYNLCLGQYLRLNEKRFTRTIDLVFGEATVMSGYDNVTQARYLRSKWDSYPDPVAIGLDASRFDQHCSPEALEFEHSFYTKVFNDPTLDELLSWQRVNKGTAVVMTGECLKYEVNGCRMSGDINTSLGNKLLMCAMVWTYLQAHDIDAKLANNGDDCVLFCSAGSVAKIMSTLPGCFLNWGYTMEVEDPVRIFERTVFCRSQPVCVDGTWAMIRQLGSLSRDCFSTHDWSNEMTFRDNMNAIGQCNGIINDGVPVHMEQAKAMWRAGGSRNFNVETLRSQIEYSWRERLGNRDRLLWSPVVPSTRLSYFLAFGIEPCVQEAVEAYLARVSLSAGGQTLPGLPRHYSRIHKDLLRCRTANFFAS